MNVFAIRHGETAWSRSGQHTGTTDIPLTDNGRLLAKRMRLALAAEAFALVLCSPMQRARETCELAGLGDKAVIDFNLVEWNYGEYEGLTPKQIEEMAPGWLIFRDGCPGGEAPEHVGARVDRVIARSRAVDGDTVLFAHGHVLRGRREADFNNRYAGDTSAQAETHRTITELWTKVAGPAARWFSISVKKIGGVPPTPTGAPMEAGAHGEYAVPKTVPRQR